MRALEDQFTQAFTSEVEERLQTEFRTAVEARILKEAQANAEVGKQVSKSPIIIIYHCPSRVQCRGRRPSEEVTIS